MKDWVLAHFTWSRDHILRRDHLPALCKHMAGQGVVPIGLLDIPPPGVEAAPAARAFVALEKCDDDVPTEQIDLDGEVIVHVPCGDVSGYLAQLERYGNPMSIGGKMMVRIFGHARVLCMVPGAASLLQRRLEECREAALARHDEYVLKKVRREEEEIEARAKAAREEALARKSKPKRQRKKAQSKS